MADIAVSPLFMAEAVFSVESDDYAAAISSMTLTPSASVVNWKGLKPTSVHSATTIPTWTCDVSFAQDDADASLFMYLWDNQGESKTVTFTPRAGGRPWTVVVNITPGAVGGSVDSYAASTVTLGVVGQPTPGALPV